MNKMLLHLPVLLLALIIALASCDKQDDIDRAYTDYRLDIVTYLGGGQMSDESIDRAVNVICAMLKADDPSLSDADADVKALRMRV